MACYADPYLDLPAEGKPVRVIFYPDGLKIYGQIPYILQRKLQGEFVSNNIPCLGGRLLAASQENNYTIIRYRRSDGTQHTNAAISDLVDFLYQDAGFEWAIAAPGEELVAGANLWQWPPETVIPHSDDVRKMLSDKF